MAQSSWTYAYHNSETYTNMRAVQFQHLKFCWTCVRHQELLTFKSMPTWLSKGGLEFFFKSVSLFLQCKLIHDEGYLTTSESEKETKQRQEENSADREKLEQQGLQKVVISWW